MTNPEKRPQEPSTEADSNIAKSIVKDLLGNGFGVEYGGLPPNVGIKGDQRHLGDTVIITSDSDSPAQTFWDHYKVAGGGLTPDAEHPEVTDIQGIMSAITSQTAASRVLIDVTPRNAEPRYKQEPIDPNTTSLEELARRRVQVYPKLAQRYWDALSDAMMCSAVLAIIDVKDAAFKQRKSLVEAERIREEAYQIRQAEIEALSQERVSQGKEPIPYPINLLH